MSDLSASEAEHVRAIAATLFLRDNVRPRSVSYAVVPYIDVNRPSSELEHLARIRAFVAYAYAAPHSVFGNPFLSTEHASLVVFSPGRVPTALVSPVHEVEVLGSANEIEVDQQDAVPGYTGLFDLKHHFWVAAGSRLYGPMPQMTLNISQDLFRDLGHRTNRPDIDLLAALVRGPETEVSDRILSAVRWFNLANAESSDQATAIVALAIAFETLLGLSEAEAKTERLAEGIALLLGSVRRLDSWARQFYRARCTIVHEGRAQQFRFIATDARKPLPDSPEYQPLLSYGNQVFRLCLAAVLTGAELAERAGLRDKFVTNQERFEGVCRILSETTGDASAKLIQIAPLVAAIDHFRFVAETGLKVKPMLTAACRAAGALLASDSPLDAPLREVLQRLVSATPTADHYDELEAIRGIHDTARALAPGTPPDEGRQSVLRLVEVIWHYTFMHYYWLREQREARAGE